MSKKSVSRESDDSTASWQSALADGALRAASSPKIFERGQTCAASGKVVITLDAKQPERSVRATVHGTEPYTTEIWHGLDPATLANKLLELADQDRDFAKTLQHWRKLSTSSLEPADLKRLITEMLSPGRDFIDWRGSYAFARQAETVLPLLQQATARDPASAVVLCAYAMCRMWLALERKASTIPMATSAACANRSVTLG